MVPASAPSCASASSAVGAMSCCGLERPVLSTLSSAWPASSSRPSEDARGTSTSLLCSLTGEGAAVDAALAELVDALLFFFFLGPLHSSTGAELQSQKKVAEQRHAKSKTYSSLATQRLFFTPRWGRAPLASSPRGPLELPPGAST